VYLQHIINLFCGTFHLYHHVDGSDDLFSQSPKRARKPSAKKDAIEDLFDNDTDEFLDQVGKEKSDPADDTPVDMVSACVRACVRACVCVCGAYNTQGCSAVIFDYAHYSTHVLH